MYKETYMAVCIITCTYIDELHLKKSTFTTCIPKDDIPKDMSPAPFYTLNFRKIYHDFEKSNAS